LEEDNKCEAMDKDVIENNGIEFFDHTRHNQGRYYVRGLVSRDWFRLIQQVTPLNLNTSSKDIPVSIIPKATAGTSLVV